MGKRVVVTGGGGFVGSNLVRLLLAQGHGVTVFDSFERGRRDYLDGLDLRIETGDLRDPAALARAFAGQDAVVHLAAFGSVIESITDPVTNFQVNVVGTLNALTAARDAGVGRFVFSSTGGALMGNTPPPVNERSVPRPISPYGASKLACEGYCSAFAEAYGLHTVIFRFANVYGPWSAHKQGVFNKYLVQIERGEDLVVFGDSVRDFIYVEDLVRGLALGLEADVAPAEFFHLSTNAGTRIEDFARHLLALRRRNDIRIVKAEGRRGEVKENFAENHKANAALGFSADTPLPAGLVRTLDWFDAHRGLWMPG
jgi:UDP-glucose 4-epimerase